MAIADLQRDLDKIKIALMDDPDSIFYTSVFFSLNHIWTDQYPTAATDGRSVFSIQNSLLDSQWRKRPGSTRNRACWDVASGARRRP